MMCKLNGESLNNPRYLVHKEIEEARLTGNKDNQKELSEPDISQNNLINAFTLGNISYTAGISEVIS